ncbi:MAG: tryptophan 7-halogenase [Rhodospirillales bacterium]|nr:tryptophan 7-halogenase [Rhodospirillales bacterium]
MIFIAGGGLAGSAAAVALARSGREVVLAERETAPAHKVCGEFISSEAQNYLAALGLDLSFLGGQPIAHVRLIRGARSVTAALPFQGISLTRQTLDEALLTRAIEVGALVQRGHAVRSISFDAGIEVRTGANTRLHPSSLLLATGKHDVRGQARMARPSRLVGFKTYLDLLPTQFAALSGHVELILFRGGYAGLQPSEQGIANLALLVDETLLRRVGRKWPDLLAHLQDESSHLAMRLAGAIGRLPAPVTIARMPYGFVHQPRPSDPADLFRLGDQAAVIPSFTGDGMAIALHSAVLAARYIGNGDTAQAYHRRLRADLAGQMRRARALHAALATPGLGTLLTMMAGVFPSALSMATSWTRIPPSATAEFFK